VASAHPVRADVVVVSVLLGADDDDPPQPVAMSRVHPTATPARARTAAIVVVDERVALPVVLRR